MLPTSSKKAISLWFVELVHIYGLLRHNGHFKTKILENDADQYQSSWFFSWSQKYSEIY